MKNRRNYYRILQVQPDASAEVIRASYHTLMRVLKQHPDLGGSPENAALLNEAYETLRDPGRRAAYDRGLKSRGTRPARAASNPKPAPAITCPVCRKPLARKPLPGERCATCGSVLQSKYPADFEKVEMRSAARIKAERPILFYSAWPGKPRTATMIDFSPNGMRFRCQERLDLKSALKICCEFFEASARVTNVSEETAAGKSLYAVGVSFLAIRFAEPKGTFLHTTV